MGFAVLERSNDVIRSEGFRRRDEPMRRHAVMGWPRRAALAGLLAVSSPVLAWVYPEHRDIGLLAVRQLDAGHKAVFDELWQDSRTGDESRLCAQGADAEQGPAPTCIDWAALQAIAGDHSCSSREMLETVRTSEWVLGVAAIGAELEADLAKVPIASPVDEDEAVSQAAHRRDMSRVIRAERSNALRTSNVRLQTVDPELATRASGNFAHFPLPRPSTDLNADAYAELTLRPGSPLSAIGVYVWFHLSAIQKASRLANEQLTPEQRRALARAALSDEAFSLHFLEDMYAAGHLAGSWGTLSQRMGTHDYYNEHGLEVFSWQRRDATFVLMGDAYMRPEDAERAAQAVRTSLEEVLDAATGRSADYDLPYLPTAPEEADDFDVCDNLTFPMRVEGSEFDTQYRAPVRAVLLQTPVPGLGPGPGELPRFRSEVGAFIGFAAGIDTSAIDGGFLQSQTEKGYVGGLDVSLRGGIGLEGALADSGDGLLFVSVGLHASSNSSNKVSSMGVGTLGGTLSSAIPARTALAVRIRMPFYVVPGDLVFMSPLYLINRDKYTKLAIRASNGGLIPWQAGLATRVGRVQFVLGREIGLTFYGRRRVDQLLVPSATPGELGQIVNYESLAFDAPILEFRPYRTFSSNQSSSVMFQLFVRADVPGDSSAAYPAGSTAPDLDTVWSLGLRMVFDWRRYQ